MDRTKICSTPLQCNARYVALQLYTMYSTMMWNTQCDILLCTAPSCHVSHSTVTHCMLLNCTIMLYATLHHTVSLTDSVPRIYLTYILYVLLPWSDGFCCHDHRDCSRSTRPTQRNIHTRFRIFLLEEYKVTLPKKTRGVG